MYTSEQIEEMFKDKISNKDYFNSYVNIYNMCFDDRYKKYEGKKYNFHHFYCSFFCKAELELKNRYNTIEELDKMYNPSENVIKLRILYHVLAHYYLGMACLNTVYEKDSVNSFYTLIGDYNKDIRDYTWEEVKELGRLVEENSNDACFDHYLTYSERKEKYKQFSKEQKEIYEQEHIDEINEYKKKQKEKQNEYKEIMKEKKKQYELENKDKIEEYKQKQKEYRKQMYQKQKEWKNK